MSETTVPQSSVEELRAAVQAAQAAMKDAQAEFRARMQEIKALGVSREEERELIAAAMTDMRAEAETLFASIRALAEALRGQGGGGKRPPFPFPQPAPAPEPAA